MNQVVLIGRLVKDFIQKEDMFVSKIRLTNNDANEISFRVTNSMYENLTFLSFLFYNIII